MKCCICQREIDFDHAYHCSFCGRDYCEACAGQARICDCYGDIERYH